MLRKIKETFFWRLYRKRNAEYLFSTPQVEFSQVLQTVDSWTSFMSEELSDSERVSFFDFLIRVISDDMRTSAASEMIYAGKQEARDFRQALFPFTGWIRPVRAKVSSEGCTVISSVYDWGKLTRATADVEALGFQTRLSNYTGAYYPELDLIAVENGLHHSCVAAQTGRSGVFSVNVYELKRLFPFVHTDGDWWYNSQDPMASPRPVRDVRFAILFELARRKETLLP